MKISDPIVHFDFFIQQLSLQLQKELPGQKAQEIMSPSIRDHALKKNDPAKARKSGVLLLLYPNREQLNISFIKRTSGNHTHSGQISLPGGKFETADVTLVQTALRETQEELGVDCNNVKVLGELTQLYIPVSNFHVLPVIGYLPQTPVFSPNPDEVDELIEIPLRELFLPFNKGEFHFRKNGRLIHAPYFNANGHRIWGATAMILSELKVILSYSGLLSS